ncbi:fructosamine kinase [Mucilaginibacter limnophilus]|uniref:Fructosamine kinase n=1 Tax=Mucilaginibacter limnophilus TaxID=1932778 RepID=A0A437MT11_9SPHI|nr:fructosamine kinase family protein [Mucilaginibacter limnophilus]RVU00797.1 fructosamine kinase [Mucilaginibacter limnophilus]
MNSQFGSIAAYLGQDIVNAIPVSGGDINRAYCLHTATGKYFLKTNSNSRFPGMFHAEANGLELIHQSNTIAVPKVILQGDHNDESFLLLEWLDTKRPGAEDARQLGLQLAAMHKSTALKFGLDSDNYMGSLAQRNDRHSTWAKFFVTQRLQPMVKMAVDKARLNIADASKFEALYKMLPGMFDEEPPALIHGDLWGGNYLIGSDGRPYLIDPAVSYGHREFDIAMTTLFGSFNNEFYVAYNEAFPLAKGWQQRLDLWNLYPLLVHVNLFGGGYAGQVRDCLKNIFS